MARDRRHAPVSRAAEIAHPGRILESALEPGFLGDDRAGHLSADKQTPGPRGGYHGRVRVLRPVARDGHQLAGRPGVWFAYAVFYYPGHGRFADGALPAERLARAAH